MIKAATSNDLAQLELLYCKSIYRKLPELVRWALNVVPERMLVIEEQQEILAAIYIDVSPAGYKHLWSSYFAFKETVLAGKLVEHLMKIREKKRLRNLYVFCPKEFVDVRVHLTALGFIPECLRKIGGMDYIVESFDGSFNPDFQMSTSKESLTVDLCKGKHDDLKTLAKILHNSLPLDFPTVEHAASDVERWLKEMPEDIIVAQHNDSPTGVLLLSSEIYPVIDKDVGMLCHIAVESRFRSQGVGKALINEACEVLRKKGKHSMEVDVNTNDISARIFYTKAGFYPFWFSKSYMLDGNGIFYRIDF